MTQWSHKIKLSGELGTLLECDVCGVESQPQIEPHDPQLWENQGWVKVGWDPDFGEYFYACPDCAKKPREDWMW